MPGALSSLKIIEIGEMISAPYASKLMADLGADVIKIERPGIGDRARTRGPFPGGSAHPEKSGLFLYLNANKRGVTLDLNKSAAMELLEKVAADADLLIHNISPPDMDRIGFNFERFRKINPRLVMTSITPYGVTGPHRDWRAEDLTLWCAGGICAINGGGMDHPEMPPLKTFGDQSGFQGGVHGAVAALGAVMAAMRDGEGQHVDVSIQEALAAQLELFFEFWPYAGLIANRLGRKPIQPVESLQCKDGWIYVCCVEEHQWRGFVEVMGNPDWANEEVFSDRFKRAENWVALKIFLEEWLSQQTVIDLYRKVQAKRVPFAPVSTMGDLLNSEHLKARGFFVEINHPVAGNQKYPGAPCKYGGTPWAIRMPAPVLGQHNQQIFGDRLGLSASRLTELKKAGVI
jgi:crotonobetainyl-CoA:carnitine CoA-transferase CaiB-like acyl-CoA transferase